MSEYIVEMKHITKRFPGIVANDDVTIQIKKGEIFALLGENGAGKSTLMSMLFGMYEPDEGEIYIRGEKVKLESPNHATKLNIGMVHQHFKLVSNYTIAENIANVNTTRTEDGTPYRRKIVTFAEKEVTSFSRYYQNARSKFVGNGVKVSSVKEDTETDFIMEYDPSNPDADENGYVSYPNVNTVTEMTNLIDSSRAYEANTTAFEAAKSIAQSGLSIGK